MSGFKIGCVAVIERCDATRGHLGCMRPIGHQGRHRFANLVVRPPKVTIILDAICRAVNDGSACVLDLVAAYGDVVNLQLKLTRTRK